MRGYKLFLLLFGCFIDIPPPISVVECKAKESIRYQVNSQ